MKQERSPYSYLILWPRTNVGTCSILVLLGKTFQCSDQCVDSIQPNPNNNRPGGKEYSLLLKRLLLLWLGYSLNKKICGLPHYQYRQLRIKRHFAENNWRKLATANISSIHRRSWFAKCKLDSFNFDRVFTAYHTPRWLAFDKWYNLTRFTLLKGNWMMKLQPILCLNYSLFRLKFNK